MLVGIIVASAQDTGLPAAGKEWQTASLCENAVDFEPILWRSSEVGNST